MDLRIKVDVRFIRILIFFILELRAPMVRILYRLGFLGNRWDWQSRPMPIPEADRDKKAHIEFQYKLYMSYFVQNGIVKVLNLQMSSKTYTISNFRC